MKRSIATYIILSLILSATAAQAKLAIHGYIKDLDGRPVKGLRVVAWDHDGLPYGADKFNDFTREDAHDRMGEAITNGNGYYHIRYYPPKRFGSGAGHWDDFSHNITQWRPDIYIAVWAPNDTFCKKPDMSWNCSWRFVHSSGVSMNHRTKDDKVIHLTVPEFFDTSCGTFGPIKPFMQSDHPDEIKGLVDMHTHPMSHLGFGAKIIHGAPDSCSLMLPGQSFCGTHNYYPPSIEQAMPHCDPSHDVWHPTNSCGSLERMGIIKFMEGEEDAQGNHGDGFPEFVGWPAHNDITHQKMWIDWVHRAHRGGLRVMVALAVHNLTLAELVDGTGPLDDVTVGDRQINEIKRMVARHHFMEVAYSSKQLREIVQRGDLAVVLGIELDDMGNFNSDPYLTDQEIRAEINRLYNKGVRYVFPVHLVDNKFSGTAFYEDVFAVANYNQTGSWWDMDPNCGDVGYRFKLNGVVEPFLEMLGLSNGFQPLPGCQGGHVNNKDLTRHGEVALREMMRLGMMIDIDHMSEKAVDEILTLLNGNYPLNSGHNSLGRASENDRTEEQYQRIWESGGMVGVGWADRNAETFRQSLREVSKLMRGQNIALGTDTNGMSKSPGPYPSLNVNYGEIPISRTGTRKWNYNSAGVAHYGLLADFMVHLKNLSTHDKELPYREDLEELYWGAENFATMWEQCELSCGSNCDDGNPCTIDSCDVRTKHCVHEPRTGSCGRCGTCSQGACVLPQERSSASCSDGRDNDCDGRVDCRDSGCRYSPNCREDNNLSCSDRKDNDGDGFVDCRDSGCYNNKSVTACQTSLGSENNDITCSDRKDNDGDGFVDCRDSGCQTTKVSVCGGFHPHDDPPVHHF